MILAGMILSAVAIIVSGCSVYWTVRLRKWTVRLRKATRELAEIRAARAARPELIIEAKGSMPPEAVALIRERAAAIRRDPRVGE